MGCLKEVTIIYCYNYPLFVLFLDSLVIGIDLGTVNSCMAIYDGQDVKILETRDGKTTPSFVFYDPKSNDVIIGETGKIVKREFENGIYGKIVYFYEIVITLVLKSVR